MSAPRPRFPSVEREWRRILARLRRQGVRKTCDYVVHLIATRPYPLAFTTRLVERLLRRGEHEAAGRIIQAVARSGAKHPLMDKLHSTWLWCIGKRKEALFFAVRSGKLWNRSYLLDHAGTLYRAMADRENSDYYRKKSDHYWRLAGLLVRREEEEERRKAADNPSTDL